MILIYSLTTKSTKCSLFQTLREPPVKSKDLQALNLVGPTRDNLVLDPLDVLHLDIQLYIQLLTSQGNGVATTLEL